MNCESRTNRAREGLAALPCAPRSTMKIGNCLLLLFGVLAFASALGSPISVPIDSIEMLSRLKIHIEHEELKGLPDDNPVVSVKVTWKPVQKDNDFPPRFDLILFRPAEPGERSERRMWVMTNPDAEGVCVSEFVVSKSEVEHAQLIFFNGQHEVHAFSLAEFLDGFPEPGAGFGAPSSRKPDESAEQNAAGQPATRPETK